MRCDKNKILKNEGKKTLVYDVYFTATNTPKPIVLFCHGYKGFKDWGAWHLVAEEFAKAGYFFVKFNFSHNGGTPEQPIDFPDLEAFAQNNYSKELDDLEQMIQHFSSTTDYGTELDHSAISLIGHSRGGGTVLIKTKESNLVQKVITWAGVSDYKMRFDEGSTAFLEWKRTGRTFVENGRTKQQMPHDWQFYEDFITNEERLTISSAMKSLSKPCLIVHGDKDPTVTINEAQQLHAWNPDSNLHVVSDADHVFGAAHPWDQRILPTDLLEVVGITISFLGTYKK